MSSGSSWIANLSPPSPLRGFGETAFADDAARWLAYDGTDAAQEETVAGEVLDARAYVGPDLLSRLLCRRALADSKADQCVPLRRIRFAGRGGFHRAEILNKRDELLAGTGISDSQFVGQTLRSQGQRPPKGD